VIDTVTTGFKKEIIDPIKRNVFEPISNTFDGSDNNKRK